MPSAPDSSRLAVLIDADNTTPTIIEALLAEIAKYGSATVKRAYGDWTTPNLRGWKEAINAHAIQPMQQFAYTTGKNATDSAMIIDAMDLLYTGNLDGFCLVSSDSDFTKLASRLRESGQDRLRVRRAARPRSRSWPRATSSSTSTCSGVRRSRSEPSGEDRPGQPPRPAGAAPSCAGTPSWSSCCATGIDAASDDDGWAHLGGVGSYVAKQAPDFDSRNWGYAKLVDLVTAIDLFEVKRSAGQGVRVREKPKGEASRKTAAKKGTARTA